ncbi:hypothetical protein [Frankia sp. CcWB3]
MVRDGRKRAMGAFKAGVGGGVGKAVGGVVGGVVGAPAGPTTAIAGAALGAAAGYLAGEAVETAMEKGVEAAGRIADDLRTFAETVAVMSDGTVYAAADKTIDLAVEAATAS